MKVVIIEDEVLLAKDLGQTLADLRPEIKIVAMLHSVEEALEYFSEENDVDLIFSDIELGDGLSFEIFKIHALTVPVIFCTAYDEYALEAFNANGIEYMLKPFSKDSLNKALEKIDVFKQSLHENLYQQYKAAKDALLMYQEKKSTTLMVRFRHLVIPISFDDIAVIYIESEITYILTLKKRSYVIQHTLDEMESQAGENFFRVNRQFLINRKAISEVSHTQHRKLNVVFSLTFHREVLVSKEKVTKFLRWLND